MGEGGRESAHGRPPVLGDAFDGFDPAVADFFDGLARDNTKAWFGAHREEWRVLVKEPMEALLALAEERHGPGRVMRMNRDVRFSRDKSPYATSSSLWAGSVGGVYLRVSSEGLDVGGGLYDPSRDQLARARQAIAERPRVAARLESVVAELTGQGFELTEPVLVTAPRGYPKDHPHVGLLRLKHYAALRHLPLEAPLADVEAAWDAVEPLGDWLRRHVGPPERPA